MNRLKKGLLAFIFFLLMTSVVWGSPFLVCDPYSGSGSVTSVEIRYAVPEQDPVVIEGTYTVSGSHIILFDLTDQYTANPTYFRARWLIDGTWSKWSDTGVTKGYGGIAPSKGTGEIAPGKGTGSISP